MRLPCFDWEALSEDDRVLSLNQTKLEVKVREEQLIFLQIDLLWMIVGKWVDEY